MKTVDQIISAIRIHQEVYEAQSLKVPPYLIFAADHKILAANAKIFLSKEERAKCSRIGSYLSVDLIIVQEVESYI